MNFFRSHILHIVSFIFVFSLFAGSTQASSPVGYARQYNLFVHDLNQNDPVSHAKGLQVLESYFMGVPLRASFQEPSVEMTQRDFITKFEKLRLEDAGVTTRLTDDQIYYKAWLNARRNNWAANHKDELPSDGELFVSLRSIQTLQASVLRRTCA